MRRSVDAISFACVQSCHNINIVNPHKNDVVAVAAAAAGVYGWIAYDRRKTLSMNTNSEHTDRPTHGVCNVVEFATHTTRMPYSFQIRQQQKMKETEKKTRTFSFIHLFCAYTNEHTHDKRVAHTARHTVRQMENVQKYQTTVSAAMGTEAYRRKMSLKESL